MKKLVWFATALALAACGDDAGTDTPDAGTDAPVNPDASPGFTPPMAHSFQLSSAGPDVIMSATPGPNGGFYAAGWVAADTDPATPKHVVVVKLLASGMPDSTFGTNGVANTQVPFVGGIDEIDVATQSSGKIIVSATVAAATSNPEDAADRDIALIRLTTAGELDETFGDNGVVTHSFSTSRAVTSGNPARDGVRGLAVGPQDAIFVHGYQLAEGTVMGGTDPRTDTDFVIAKFDASGELVTSYGDGGTRTLDIYNNADGVHSGATARGIHAFADGSVIAGGYANAGLTMGPQAVLIKLTPDGDFDPAFDDDGWFHDTVLGVQTEVYNVAVHGDHIVTAGYGRDTGSINDWISLRFKANTGVRDKTWGGDGEVLFDPTPDDNMAGSNCRNAIALPDGKTMLLGSSSRMTNNGGANPEVQDAVFAILDENGELDTGYGTGIVTYALGDDGVDAFWGGAVNGGNALIVGFRGAKAGNAQTATDNDDAYAVLLPLR